MTTNDLRAEDALKYAAAILRKTVEWTGDAISGSDCDPCEHGIGSPECDHRGHETELDALADVANDVAALAAQFGDPHRYSDGRAVKTGKWIQKGLHTEHVWQPDPSAEPRQSWTSHLPSDPDVDSPGVFQVSLNPDTQNIAVTVVRTA